jgi:nitroimidazol reductase NimA-like FMN-containing flavoprotein (pyridoxamine 5'-phosphate oxidase superfamily)
MGVVPSEIADRIRNENYISYLATTTNDRPHVVPIWYRYADDTLWFTTNGPKKVANIKRNPRVAATIQHDIDGHPQWMVSFRGQATVYDDVEVITDITRKIYEVYVGSDPDEWDDRRQQQVTNPNPERRVIEMEIGSVFSKEYVDDDGLKDE